MENALTPVTDREALGQLLDRSHQAPVLLFKHDTACPISAAAHREMSQLAEAVSLIDVNSADDVSREIETRTGVRHESPQVLILRNGDAVWSASHYNITAATVAEAMRGCA